MTYFVLLKTLLTISHKARINRKKSKDSNAKQNDTHDDSSQTETIVSDYPSSSGNADNSDGRSGTPINQNPTTSSSLANDTNLNTNLPKNSNKDNKQQNNTDQENGVEKDNVSTKSNHSVPQNQQRDYSRNNRNNRNNQDSPRRGRNRGVNRNNRHNN